METPPPGLPPRPDLGRINMSVGFVLWPARFLDACQAKRGDFFTLHPQTGRWIVVTSDPATIKEVFTGDPNLLYAGAGNIVLQPILGSRSVLLLDGPEHLRQRRLMLPSFHGERMRVYADVMRAAAERAISQWPRGRRFDVLPSMQAITLEVILRAVFGITEPERLKEMGGALRSVLDTVASRRRVLSLALTAGRTGPLSPWGRFVAARRRADELLHAEIEARRREGDAERDDVLSLLLAARDEDGRALSDEELRDELMTLLVAGHETTATALAWTLERLARHPRALAGVVAEQRAGGEELLDATIKETLRLRPVVPAVVRQLQAPMTFGGWDLPAGVHIGPSIYLLHRRADLYPDPLAFRPERFLERSYGTYEWIPFGGGVRRCLGASFALFEMRIVLATLLERVELQPSRGAGEAVARRAITFAPARGGRIAVA
jgi:cytochrome P450 family 135